MCRSHPFVRFAAGVSLMLGAWTGRMAAQVADHIPALASLPAAEVKVDASHGNVLIELPAVDLPASSPNMESMVSLPAYQVRIPIDLALTSVEVNVFDGDGHELPRTFLHHLTLTDPGRRDLFLPTQLHILAVSKETPTISMPKLLLGLPLPQGERLLTIGMLSNPTSTAHHGVRIRATLGYRALGFFPLFHAFPWGMDAMFPLGHPPDGTRASICHPAGRSASGTAAPRWPAT